jgi:hypothetical protein
VSGAIVCSDGRFGMGAVGLGEAWGGLVGVEDCLN